MILRHNEIKKIWDDPGSQALRQLRSFLRPNEPELMRFLYRTWEKQAKAITYREIREALLSMMVSRNINEISFFAEVMDDWNQDYSKYVLNTIAPAWEKAMHSGIRTVQGKIPDWKYFGYEEGVARWVREAGASFVTNSTHTQLEALKHIISRAADYHEMNVDTLSHAIRPTVGLTKQQANQNMNYFQAMIEDGTSPKVALDRAAKHAAQLHRKRAYTIARTELAFAYNHGEDMAVRQAQKDGYLGEMRKQWVTADDERVCKICGILDGVVLDMDAVFEFDTRLTYPGVRLTAPAHPRCRCVVIYIEVEDPGVHLKIKNNGDGGEKIE